MSACSLTNFPDPTKFLVLFHHHSNEFLPETRKKPLFTINSLPSRKKPNFYTPFPLKKSEPNPPFLLTESIFFDQNSRCAATGSKKATASPASDGNNKKSKATRQTARLASAPYSAPFCVFLCVNEWGWGGGWCFGWGGLKVETFKLKSLREWVPLPLYTLFHRLDICTNHFGVLPMCMIIFGGFLYTSALMMVMSVM